MPLRRVPARQTFHQHRHLRYFDGNEADPWCVAPVGGWHHSREAVVGAAAGGGDDDAVFVAATKMLADRVHRHSDDLNNIWFVDDEAWLVVIALDLGCCYC